MVSTWPLHLVSSLHNGKLHLHGGQLYLAEVSLTEQQPAFIWRQRQLEDPLLPSVASELITLTQKLVANQKHKINDFFHLLPWQPVWAACSTHSNDSVIRKTLYFMHSINS